jgi:hypothetical protein
MSANALIVTVLSILVLTAVAARVVIGPIPALASGNSLYAMAKAGPAPGSLAVQVEMAASDAGMGQ